MSTLSDFHRRASAWLAEGPTELNDRVLEAALSEVHMTKQRRRLPTPWRTSPMSRTLRIAAGIAIVAVIGVGALALSRSPGFGEPGTPTPSPAPTTSPTTVAGTPTTAPTDAEPTPSPVPIATFPSTSELAAEPPPGSIVIEMTSVNDKPRFVPGEVQASAGTITFFLDNPRHVPPPPHNFKFGPELGVVQAASPNLQSGQSVAFTVEDVPAGTYVFWCDIRYGDDQPMYQLGMVGTLTVTP